MSIYSLLNVFNSFPEGNTYYDIVSILLKNLDKIEDKSIYELADMCYTNTSAMSRLAKLAGYSSFSAFRDDIADSYHVREHLSISVPYSPANGDMLAHYTARMHQAVDEFAASTKTEYLREIAAAIHESKRVNFYLPTTTDFITRTFQFCLALDKIEMRSIPAFPVAKKHAKTLSEGDFVILNSCGEPRKGVYFSDIASDAVACGAKVLSIASEEYDLLIGASTFSLVHPKNLTGSAYHYYYYFIEALSMVYREMFMNF